jgi:hypothetical protein
MAWRTAFNLMARFSTGWQRQEHIQRAGQRWRYLPLEQIHQEVVTSIADYERRLKEKQMAANYNSSQSGRAMTGPDASPGSRLTEKHGKASQHV